MMHSNVAPRLKIDRHLISFLLHYLLLFQFFGIFVKLDSVTGSVMQIRFRIDCLVSPEKW